MCMCHRGFSGSRCETRPDDVCKDVSCAGGQDQTCYQDPDTSRAACPCEAGKTHGGRCINCKIYGCPLKTISIYFFLENLFKIMS